MKSVFVKFACISAFLASASSAIAAESGYLEYFDCWLEKATTIVPKERFRIGSADNAMVCGCFEVKEQGGWKWRGTEPKQITKVWNIPKPKITPCNGENCEDDAGAIQKCVDYIQSTSVSLADFKTGKPLDGAIAFTYENDGWSNTPFGEYFEKRKDHAADIDCFFNIHERPDAESDDLSHPENFSFSGMPKKLVPGAVARFTDYSDVRCLENGELTGFAFNGYKENVRHVDNKGLLQGEEVGYLNDPTYPVKQDDKWGKIAWTANNKNGMREGLATFYKSSAADNSDKTYYFKHLEIPFKQGFRDGTARMYAENGFVMAEIPQKRNGLHGRMTVNNPFKKKKVTLTFNANHLEGFVDFGDFGGVYHNGLPNGLITFWAVKDTCYQWMQGEKVCYTERLKKTQWGTYKMGQFKGFMECWNGQKGDSKLVCPPLPADSLRFTPAARDSIARLDSLAKTGDTAAIALVHAGKIKDLQQKVKDARGKAAQKREVAAKSKEAAAKALEAADLADREAKQAESEVFEAEKELEKLENPEPEEEMNPKAKHKGWKDKKKENKKKNKSQKR